MATVYTVSESRGRKETPSAANMRSKNGGRFLLELEKKRKMLVDKFTNLAPSKNSFKTV